MSKTSYFKSVWILVSVLILTCGFAFTNARSNLQRYHEMNLGWSWDLAYYNQWFRALTLGDGTITIRPASQYGREGQSIWRANYLAPIRYLIAPAYAMAPGPETLLIIQAAIFAMIVPAAFVLAKGESGSSLTALAAAGTTLFTPLLLPLGQNDFRELQLAFPFVFLALEGVRGRRPGVTVLGVAGLLACRQEYAILVTTLAFIKPRTLDDLADADRWGSRLWLVGTGWMVLFLGYLAFARSPVAPEQYLSQFSGTRAPLHQTPFTAAELAIVGLGGWSITAWAVPRVAILVLPWLWSLSAGRWSLRFLGTEEWHHVRYAAPFVAIGTAAGVLGFARLMQAATKLDAPKRIIAQGILIAAVGLSLIAGRTVVAQRWAEAPRALSIEETKPLWEWIAKVDPDAGVIADYRVSAPLSSRQTLYSYIIPSDPPTGFPKLDAVFQYVFARRGSQAPQLFLNQGFEVVHEGKTIWVYRRIASTPTSHAVIDQDGRFRWEPERLIPVILSGAAPALLTLVVMGIYWSRFLRNKSGSGPRSTGDTGREVARRMLDDVPGTRVDPVLCRPFDVADPARRSVRLSPEFATSRNPLAVAVAAIEAAHLRLALQPGWIGRFARYRPELLFLIRMTSISSWMAILIGLLLCNPGLFESGFKGILGALALALIELPLELASVRIMRRYHPAIDRRVVAAAVLRHPVETFSIPWRAIRIRPRTEPIGKSPLE